MHSEVRIVAVSFVNMKTLITYLFKRFCVTADAFFIEKKEYSKEEQDVMNKECEIMLKTGILQNIVDMIVAESEQNQLYLKGEHQYELYHRKGIERLINKIKALAGKVPKEGAEFNKHEAI